MKTRYITPVAVAALAVLSASGAMAATTGATHVAKPAAAHVQPVSTSGSHEQQRVLYQSSTVGSLPATGEVRLKGEVTDAATGSFMLKDSSGTIKVEEPQNNHISLKDDAEVTVYGRIMGTGTDKYIAAHRIVTAQAHPAATHSTTTTKN